MDILNSKQTLIKGQFSYFKINSIGNVTGYDAINLPDGMTIYRPDGYIYGTPIKQQTKSSVFLAKNQDKNIYKIVEIQVTENNKIPFSISETINDYPRKIDTFTVNSGQLTGVNLNNLLYNYYKNLNAPNVSNYFTSGMPVYSVVTQNIGQALKFYKSNLLSCNSILLNNNLSNVSEVSIGLNHALAILDSGKVTGWGDNTYGQVSGGISSYSNWNSTPVGILTGAKQVSAGTNYSLALLQNGKITGWGINNFNQALGGNNLNGVISIAVGNNHSLALLANGQITGFGDNTYNQITNVNNLTNVSGIAAGNNYSLALLQNGRVTGWGDNIYGQATGGNDLTGIIKISANKNNSVALTNDKRIITWGIKNNISDPIGYVTGIYSPTGTGVIIAPGVTQPEIPQNPINCAYIDLKCNDRNQFQTIVGYDPNNCPIYDCAPCPPLPNCSAQGFYAYPSPFQKDRVGCTTCTCIPCTSTEIIDLVHALDFIYYEGPGSITISFSPISNWSVPIPQLIWGDEMPFTLSRPENLPTNYLNTKTTWTISHTYADKIEFINQARLDIIGYDSNNCPIYKFVYGILLDNVRNVVLSSYKPSRIKSGDTIYFYVKGNVGGSSSSNNVSLDTGYWPAGIDLRLVVPIVRGSDPCNPYEGVVAGRGGGFCGGGNPYGGPTSAILVRRGVSLVVENYGIIGGGGNAGRDNPCCCGEGGGGAGIPGGKNNGGGKKTCCGGEGPGQILCGGNGAGGSGSGGNLNTGAPTLIVEPGGSFSFSPKSTRPYFG